MQRRFVQCDVFSDTALRGNGLAVVLDGEGLSIEQMQRFAIWTRQAETTFILPPTDAQRVLELDASAVSWPDFVGVSVMGRHPTGGEVTYETRNLTPASLMSEDPITGSMNAAIAVWLRDEGRLNKDIVIAQGTATGCLGRIFVRRRGDDVLIGGHTTVVIDGKVDL